MGYPFNTTPLNESLLTLNQLAIEESACYQIKCKNNVTTEEILSANNQLVLIKAAKVVVYESDSLMPREFDVFLGVLDTALKEFEKQNPRPEKPTPCKHLDKDKRLRTLKGNITKVVNQCLNCGSSTDDFKKVNTLNWQELPSFDCDLKLVGRERYSLWQEEQRKVVNSIVGDDNALVMFNYEEFDNHYKRKKPRPISPMDCLHENTMLTLRVYSETSDAVVKQCSSCGKHIKSVSKKSVTDLATLPAFNKKTESALYESISHWCDEHLKAVSQARNTHYLGVIEKVETGVIAIEDKTTFGAYYDSPEWQRTRKRILGRDSYECQSCSSNAECVHHIVYDRLGCENDLDLISLCNRCHSEVHHHQNLFETQYRLAPKDIKTLLQR